MSTEIKIEPEFENYIPGKLSEEQFEQLEQSIVKDGCRDPLVVWAEKNILLDGHHRHKICTKHDLLYQVVKMEFDSEDSAKLWMLSSQSSRRNNTEEQLILMAGMAYKLQKKSHGGDRKSDTVKSNGTICHLKSTAEKVGAKFKMSPRAARNAVETMEAVKVITDTVDPKFQDNYLQGVHPSKAVIHAAAKVAKVDPEAAKKILTEKPQRKKKYIPENGVEYATMAICQLEKINKNDSQKEDAFNKIIDWVEENSNTTLAAGRKGYRECSTRATAAIGKLRFIKDNPERNFAFYKVYDWMRKKGFNAQGNCKKCNEKITPENETAVIDAQEVEK